MKYLVLLLIVMGGIWWIRQQRPQQVQPPKASQPEPMVACTHCGTHAPEKDMVTGRLGKYCSLAHQRAHEGQS